MAKALSSRLAKVEAASGAMSKPTRLDLVKCSEGHSRQLAFVQSKARQSTASCSRRAGKTEGCAELLLDAATTRPGCVALYLTMTRIQAKRNIWGVLKRINREEGLGGNAKEAELCLEMPNGSTVYLGGVNHKDEIEKFRGLPLAVVVVDEAQSIPGHLEALIDEVLAPALMDYDGRLVLAGTPAPVPSGYFYDCVQNPAWEHFSWTVFDNPWIERKSGKSPQEHLELECARRGVTPDDPKIQREYFGRWAYDPNSLVFRYNAGLNDFGELPTSKREWLCVVGVDLGHDDADAIGVLEWNDELPNLWLTEESVLPKQTITQLGDRLAALVARKSPLRVVVDTGGLGKKIAEELTQRWGLKVEAAEKERKLEHIELLNDAMRTGRFFAKKDSRFAQDCMLVEWDKTNPEKWKISDRYHSDICDAVLYAYRRAKQWLYESPPEPKPKPGTPEWQAAQAKAWTAEGEQLKDAALEQALREKAEKEEWEQWQ